MRNCIRAVAIGLAWALCLGALADDRVAPDPRPVHAEGVEGLGAESESRPLGNEQLGKLRGRLAVPMAPQQAGVVLWDEPSKGLPPVRTSGESNSASSVTTSFTVHFK